jgi:hypothetical protein
MFNNQLYEFRLQMVNVILSCYEGGLGGLVVSVLATRPRFTGSNPAKNDGSLRAIKLRNTTPFGGEVKEPCGI